MGCDIRLELLFARERARPTSLTDYLARSLVAIDHLKVPTGCRRIEPLLNSDKHDGAMAVFAFARHMVVLEAPV